MFRRSVVPVAAARGVALLGVVAMVALILGGCGGGGEGVMPAGPAGNTATVEGTVYTTGMSSAAVGDKQAQVPAAGAEVTAEGAQSGQALGSTTTDSQGQYAIAGLATGEEIRLRARLQTGEQLMTRLRVQARTCQADITEDTTMAEACRQVMEQAGAGPNAQDPSGEQLAYQLCYQYQEQYQYQYREQAGPPDFSDEAEVQAAARELIEAATGEAVGLALRTRLRADCEGAAAMLQAWLRARNELGEGWGEQIRQRLAEATQNRWQGSNEQAASAASGALGQQISAGEVERRREQVRQRIQAFGEGELDPLQLMAALCIKDQERTQAQEQARLRTGQQIESCLEALGVGQGGGVMGPSYQGDEASGDQDRTRDQERAEDPCHDPDGDPIQQRDRDQDRTHGEEEATVSSSAVGGQAGGDQDRDRTQLQDQDRLGQ